MNDLIWTMNYWGRKLGFGSYLARMGMRQFTKRVLRRDLRIELPNRRWVTLPKWSGFASVVWVTRGQAEDGCEEVMECFGDPAQMFCDVGAHFGYWGVRQAHCSGLILAVEPNPLCESSLRDNLASVSGSCVAMCALSDQNSSLRFFAAESSPYSRLLGPDEALPERAGKIIHVPVRTLDEVWREQGSLPCWGIKVDTEGHEAAVFAGARELIEQCRPVVLVETKPETFRCYERQFADAGYTAGWLSERVRGERQRLHRGDIGSVAKGLPEEMLFLFPAWARKHPGWTRLSQLFKVTP